MTRSEREKRLAGELFHPGAPDVQADLDACGAWLARYNAALGEGAAAWRVLLGERLGAVGEGALVRPPFYCDYGDNIHLGANVFLNYDCVILDAGRVTIGDDTRIGPAVQIYTADHPRDPAVRRSGLESGLPVTIGSNVWIGGGAVILPGVTIGDDAIVGAGSVVTRDVPPGSTVVGNPARVLGADPVGDRAAAHARRE